MSYPQIENTNYYLNALKNGAIMADSESLLYSGYTNLNLTRIYMAGIFVGASGAMMDLSVDITSGISEVVQKKPDISRREAIYGSTVYCSGRWVYTDEKKKVSRQ